MYHSQNLAIHETQPPLQIWQVLADFLLDLGLRIFHLSYFLRKLKKNLKKKHILNVAFNI